MTAPAAADWLRFTHGVSELLEHGADPGTELLDRVVRTAVATIPGVEDASLSVLRRDEHRCLSASGDVARDFDGAQETAGQGPCMSAIRNHTTVVVDNLQQDARWPLLREGSVDDGPRSALSVPLEIPGGGGGAVPVGLNLLSPRTASFDRAAVAMGGTLAWCASSVITEADVEVAVAALPQRTAPSDVRPAWSAADRSVLTDLAHGMSASTVAARAGIHITTLAGRLARMRRQRGVLSTNELVTRFAREDLHPPEV